MVLYHSMGRFAEALEMQRMACEKFARVLCRAARRDELIYAGWAAQGDLLLELGQIDEAVRLSAATNARMSKQMKTRPSHVYKAWLTATSGWANWTKPSSITAR